MEDMANAAEIIDKNARESERRKILLMAIAYEANGENLAEFIDKLKAMDEG